MGKSSKKSNVEFAAASVSVPSVKSCKKGKRNTEEAIEKPVSAKKHKREVEEVVPKQKDGKKSKKASQEPPPKKVAETSSSEDLTSSESEEEEPAKVTAPLKKLPATGAKNGAPAISKKKQESSDSSDSDSSSDEDAKPAASIKKPPVAVSKKKPESSDSSSESDSDEEDEEPTKVAAPSKKLPATGAKNGTPAISKKKQESTDSSDSDSSSDEDAKPAASIKKPPVAVSKKKSESSDSSSESDSDEEVAAKVPAGARKPPPKAAPVTVSMKKQDSSESSESDSEDEEDVAKVALPSKGTPASSVKKEESSDSSESDSDEDDIQKSRHKAKVDPSSEESSDESDEEPQRKKLKVPDTVPANANKPTVKLVKKESSSSDDDDSSEESSDEETSKQPQNKKPTKASAESSSSEDYSSEEESEDEQLIKTPKKKDSDVKMKDAPLANATVKQTATKSDNKAPKTPASSQTSGSKTIFVGNLSFDAGQDDVAEFFKESGEIADVRLAVADDGRFKGFGHVEFATEDAAQKALELNGKELLGRALRLDLARERGAHTPYSGKEGNSYQKGGKGLSHTVFVKGFDKSLEEDQIRSSLEEHFGSCGEITRLSIPKDYETGAFRGMAYMDFREQDAFSKAMELDGSELAGYTLIVDEAKPRGDSRDGGWSGDRDSAGRGRGRFGGGQRGGRGGRGGGGGRGGFRERGENRNKQSTFTASAGKKTTFSDD